MRKLLTSFLLLATSCFCIFLRPAFAAPLTLQFVDVFTDNRCQSCFEAGYKLLLDIGFSDSLGVNDIVSVTAAQGAQTFNLQSSPTFDNVIESFSFLPYAGQTGVYNFTVTTLQSGTLTASAHNLDHPEQVALATNLAVNSLSTTTPIFSFTEPADPNRGQFGYATRDQMVIFDASTGNQLYASDRTAFPSGQASFQVPPGILSVGKTYVIAARTWDLDGLPTSAIDTAENRSWNQILVTPVPEPATLNLMVPAMFGLICLERYRRRISKVRQ